MKTFGLRRELLFSLFVVIPLIGLLWPGPGTSRFANRMEILVPAYFYPGSGDPYWPAMAKAASRVPITVVVNPGSGPGTQRDRNYVEAVNKLRAAGGRAIGYVHTSYAKRPIELVINEVSRYLSFYSLDGFFIDEMANTTDPETLIYYRNIYKYIKDLRSNFVVVGNPGTNTDPKFLDLPTADAVINFESPLRVYDRYKVSSWVDRYPAEKFGHLIFDTKTKDDMREAVGRALDRNARFVFVTNDVMSNPWDNLPRWWPSLVSCVATINKGSRC